VEVFDCIAVIAHVLIDKTSLYVNRLVLRQLFHHERKLPDCLVEIAGSAVHEPLMEHAAGEAVIADQCVPKALDCTANQGVFQSQVSVLLLRGLLRFTLVSQAFRMVVFSLRLVVCDCFVVLLVSLLELVLLSGAAGLTLLSQAQVDVT